MRSRTFQPQDMKWVAPPGRTAWGHLPALRKLGAEVSAEPFNMDEFPERLRE